MDGEHLPRIAATLGVRLGPDWDADRLVRHIERTLIRPVLTRPDRPLAYLAWLLDTVFTGAEEPPETTREHAEHRRQEAIAQAAAATAAHEQLRAQLDAQATAAKTTTGNGLAAFRAARAALGHRPTSNTAPAEPAAWSTPGEQPAAPGSGRLPAPGR